MNADQRRAPTPDGGSRSPGHGPKIRPVDDRTLGLQSDPLDFYKTLLCELLLAFSGSHDLRNAWKSLNTEAFHKQRCLHTFTMAERP